jgi:alpha-mannosidase
LEIEPVSWGKLKSDDPETFYRLQQHLNKPGDSTRIEIVSSSFAQPYCWNIGGESNIRQLSMGLDELHKYFPKYSVTTYSVQEPCWTSSLPSILLSLGYTGAVLKDPNTAFAGYTKGVNASIIYWTGPDGASIPAVPRYQCENLDSDVAWRTDCNSVNPQFVQRCYSNGIKFPIGTAYQDLGWPAHPAVDLSGNFYYIPPKLKQWTNNFQFKGPYWWCNKTDIYDSLIRFVTWKEFLNTIIPEPTKSWNFSQEDIWVGLTWGSSALNKIAQKVHKAERQVLTAEKLTAIAYTLNKLDLPEQKLDYAWQQLLLSQHHDAWICSYADEPTDRWTSFTYLKTSIASQLSEEISEDARQSICNSFQSASTRGNLSQWICVTNTLGFNRNEPVEITASFNSGTKYIEVTDKDGNRIPCQVKPTRWYGDGAINSAKITFFPSVPSLGYSFYQIKTPSSTEKSIPSPACSVKETSNGIYTLESDLNKITLDANKGGIFTSWVDKKSGREIVDLQNERGFNEYRGYFPQSKAWFSSKDSIVSVEIIENGPIKAQIILKGKIGKGTVETVITSCLGQRYIDFQTSLQFEKGILIGEPWDGDAPPREEPRKPCFDSKWKLQAFFPSALKNPTLYKNAAYDVCESRLDSTFFNSWMDIRHNIILDWVDVYDSTSSYGLTLFSDRTTSYSFAKNYPLAYTLAYSGSGLHGQNYPMSETLKFQYALCPHSDKWNEANVNSENASWNEPLDGKVILNEESCRPLDYSFIESSDKHVEVSALFIKDKALFVRLFNANDKTSSGRLTFSFPVEKVESVELDGRTKNEIEVLKNSSRSDIQLKFPPFGMTTLKIN